MPRRNTWNIVKSIALCPVAALIMAIPATMFAYFFMFFGGGLVFYVGGAFGLWSTKDPQIFLLITSISSSVLGAIVGIALGVYLVIRRDF